MPHLFNVRSFPKAILHVDGDAFFASCETALNPSLKGKCVITGKERGIVSSMSYEAKRRGITRGMILSDVRKVCPEAIILPSDYETYSIFSRRMYTIVRRYTPEVEEYSIDECFGDLTGLRRLHRMPYSDMAAHIKRELEGELGMTFSIGLAPTKVLAKVASTWKKPSGFTVISGRRIEEFLKELPLEKVWGIGPSTSAFLKKKGVKSALDFATRPQEWVEEQVSKPYQEIWYELRGTSIYGLSNSEREYKSISKTRTFTPPSTDKAFVFSQLSKNIENACIKLRRYGLRARALSFYIKTQDFRYSGLEIRLSTASAVPSVIIHCVAPYFNRVYISHTPYRATGVTLFNISSDLIQQDLFGESVKVKEISRIFDAVDVLAEKFGKHTVFLGSSLRAMKSPQHTTGRGEMPHRKKRLFQGENKRQRLAIPLLGEVT